MDHHEWIRARFDVYARFTGRMEGLINVGRYSASDLRAKIKADVDELDADLGRLDGLVMDNGQQPADHAP